MRFLEAHVMPEGAAGLSGINAYTQHFQRVIADQYIGATVATFRIGMGDTVFHALGDKHRLARPRKPASATDVHHEGAAARKDETCRLVARHATAINARALANVTDHSEVR